MVTAILFYPPYPGSRTKPLKQCCGSGSVSVRIRFRIQGFDDQKLDKTTAENKFFVFYQKLQPTKENIHHFKTWNSPTFFLCWSFEPSWIRIQPTKSMRIRIRNTASNWIFFQNQMVERNKFFFVFFKVAEAPRMGTAATVPTFGSMS